MPMQKNQISASEYSYRMRQSVTTFINYVFVVIVLAVVARLLWYCLQVIRRKKDAGHLQPLTKMYGAWQDHNLGTSDLEPGELSEIERDLIRAAKHERNLEGFESDEEPDSSLG